MLTPSKILFLILILVAVWWLWRVIERRNPGGGGRSRTGGAVDLVKCPTCGDWVEGACERSGCKASDDTNS